jgi:hypothetical protein
MEIIVFKHSLKNWHKNWYQQKSNYTEINIKISVICHGFRVTYIN